jgi:single-strand DNA-binding protein
MNKFMLIGRLVKDPELRHSANGTPIANMRIATDTDHAGNKVKRTEWHTVVVFNRPAENCQNYLKKDSLVWVEGSIEILKWQDPQGQDRYAREIKASRVVFLDIKIQQNAQDRLEPVNKSYVSIRPPFICCSFDDNDGCTVYYAKQFPWDDYNITPKGYSNELPLELILRPDVNFSDVEVTWKILY